MVPKAVTVTQEQHGLFAQRLRRHRLLLGQRVSHGHGCKKGFVVQWRDRQAGVGKRLGQNRTINFTGTQHFHQLDGEIFL